MSSLPIFIRNHSTIRGIAKWTIYSCGKYSNSTNWEKNDKYNFSEFIFEWIHDHRIENCNFQANDDIADYLRRRGSSREGIDCLVFILHGVWSIVWLSSVTKLVYYYMWIYCIKNGNWENGDLIMRSSESFRFIDVAVLGGQNLQRFSMCSQNLHSSLMSLLDRLIIYNQKQPGLSLKSSLWECRSEKFQIRFSSLF